MTVGLYMDVHVRRAVTDGLRLRGVDVLTAQQDGASELGDPDLLNRATSLGRLLFTQDEDLLREAKRRQQLCWRSLRSSTQYHDWRVHSRSCAHC